MAKQEEDREPVGLGADEVSNAANDEFEDDEEDEQDDEAEEAE